MDTLNLGAEGHQLLLRLSGLADPTRNIISGVAFDTDRVWVTDSFLLAWATYGDLGQPEFTGPEKLTPVNSSALKRAMGPKPVGTKTTEIKFEDGAVVVDSKSMTASVPVLEGKYPDCRTLVEKPRKPDSQLAAFNGKFVAKVVSIWPARKLVSVVPAGSDQPARILVEDDERGILMPVRLGNDVVNRLFTVDLEAVAA